MQIFNLILTYSILFGLRPLNCKKLLLTNFKILTMKTTKYAVIFMDNSEIKVSAVSPLAALVIACNKKIGASSFFAPDSVADLDNNKFYPVSKIAWTQLLQTR